MGIRHPHQVRADHVAAAVFDNQDVVAGCAGTYSGVEFAFDVPGSVSYRELKMLAAVFNTDNIDVHPCSDGSMCLVKVST